MADGFSVLYLGYSDTNKELLQRLIDHCVWKAAPLFLFPKCNKSRLMAMKWIPMSFQWLLDLFSLIASPRIFYSGWSAPCDKHINTEHLIPAVILGLNNPESQQSVPQWDHVSQHSLGIGNRKKYR